MIAFASWIKKPVLQPPPIKVDVDDSRELLAVLGYSIATADNTENTPYLKHLMGE